MKRLQLIPLLLLLLFLLSACTQDGFVMIALVSEGTHSLEPGEVIHGPLIISGGEMFLEAGSQVDGDVYMLDGDLFIDGEVSGEVSFINGSLDLGSNAIIQGDLNIGGTEITQSPQARVLGRVNRGSGIQIPSVPETQGPSLGEQIIRSTVEGLILGILAYVLMRYQRTPLKRMSEAAAQHPTVSLAMGVLVAIIGVSLLITIAFTILLIPVSLLGLFVMGIAIIIGWIACGAAGANFVLNRWMPRLKPEIGAFFTVFIFMTLILLISRFSGFGSLLLLLISCLGLGAVFLTRFGLRRFVPASDWEEN